MHAGLCQTMLRRTNWGKVAAGLHCQVSNSRESSWKRDLLPESRAAHQHIRNVEEDIELADVCRVN